MKPNFALSLSFEGIRLLHRAAGGWRLVGEVPLTADDVPGELATLRRTASSLEPGGVRSKLLLPNEQIKFLTIETPGLSEAERRAKAAEALDGATPYEVSELVYDISLDGDRTHVAAVAQETLEEAEAFAVEHRFHPVSFAAIPADEAYLGEPYFGQTSGAAELLEGETVEPDGIAVVVIGNVTMPKGPVADDAKQDAPAGEEAQAKPVPPAVAVPAEPEEKEASAPEPAAPVLSKPQDAEIEPAPFRSANVAEAGRMPALGPARRDEPSDRSEAGVQTPLPAVTAFTSRRGAKPEAPKKSSARKEPSLGAAPARQEEPRPAVHADALSQAAPAPAAPAPTPAPRAGFLSRRKPKAPRAEARPTPVPQAARAPSEAERMTIFGARDSQIGGKPRFLGLLLTVVLLVFLAGVAAWAAVFLDENATLTRLFGDRPAEPAFSDPEAAEERAPAPVEDQSPVVDTQIASLDPALTEEDDAVLEALRSPVELPQPAPEELTEAAQEAKYAATGIWTRAPETPPEPAGQITLEDLYVTGIDPVSTATDALALPAAEGFDTDLVIAALASPAAPGTAFTLDARGLVTPTEKGTLTPDGVLVYLGKPPRVPPAIMARAEPEAVQPQADRRLAAFRPQPRPGDLQETYERGQFDGLTRSELAGFRPEVRPKSLQEEALELAAQELDTDSAVAAALAAPSPFENATQQAAEASRRPDARPRNFDRIVKRAERSTAREPVRVAAAASIAPRSVAPKIPSRTSVAKQATVKNAINLRRVNLIGVYGKPSSRRALVRLSNGRYQKVVVGDRLDGGRVSAIGESELRYRKGSRDVVLKMPRG